MENISHKSFTPINVTNHQRRFTVFNRAKIQIDVDVNQARSVIIWGTARPAFKGITVYSHLILFGHSIKKLRHGLMWSMIVFPRWDPQIGHQISKEEGGRKLRRALQGERMNTIVRINLVYTSAPLRSLFKINGRCASVVDYCWTHNEQHLSWRGGSVIYRWEMYNGFSTLGCHWRILKRRCFYASKSKPYDRSYINSVAAWLLPATFKSSRLSCSLFAMRVSLGHLLCCDVFFFPPSM